MARAPQKNDRRFDDRHPGTGLVAFLGEEKLEVLDVSIGGIKLPMPAERRFTGDMVHFVMHSTHWPDMKAASGKGLVRALGRDWIAIQFERPSYDLMKCVSRHVATLLWGDQPYGY